MKLPNAREELLEALEETPAVTFFRCIAMQLLGWHAYMSYVHPLNRYFFGQP